MAIGICGNKNPEGAQEIARQCEAYGSRTKIYMGDVGSHDFCKRSWRTSERQIKHYKREWKNELVDLMNPNWEDLTGNIIIDPDIV